MFIFGSGKKTKRFDDFGGQPLIAHWNYIHLFWCPIASNIKWVLFDAKGEEGKIIPYDEVKEMFPENPPKVNLWERFGLIIVVSGLIILQLVREGAAAF